MTGVTAPEPGFRDVYAGACIVGRIFLFYSLEMQKRQRLEGAPAGGVHRLKPHGRPQQASRHPRSLSVIPLIFCTVLSTAAFSQGRPDTLLPRLQAEAYAMLRTRPAEAAKLFERIAALDSSDVLTRRQLGYLYHSQQDYNRALAAFSSAEAIRSSDTVRLQMGYTLAALGRSAEADSVFRSLASSPSVYVRDGAALQIGPSSPGGTRWRTSLYSAVYYDTRWSTTFFQAHLDREVSLTDDRLLSAYGTIAYSGDARSRGGQAPEIFSDDAVILGLGLRARPFTGFSVSIQEGVAFNLIDRPQRATVEEDFRIVGIYGWGIYAPFSVHPDARATLAPFADLYVSAGIYSRYSNAIAYAGLRGGLRVLEVSHTAVDAYLRLAAARDMSVRGGLFNSWATIGPDQYYNNVHEWGVGLRCRPYDGLGFWVMLEALRGIYANESLLPAGHDRYYNSARLFLIYDVAF